MFSFVRPLSHPIHHAPHPEQIGQDGKLGPLLRAAQERGICQGDAKGAKKQITLKRCRVGRAWERSWAPAVSQEEPQRGCPSQWEAGLEPSGAWILHLPSCPLAHLSHHTALCPHLVSLGCFPAMQAEMSVTK